MSTDPRTELIRKIAYILDPSGTHLGIESKAARIVDALDLDGRDARVRQETDVDLARQLDMLASDEDLLARWRETCEPPPLTVADSFRALAVKLRRTASPSSSPVDAPSRTTATPGPHNDDKEQQR